MVIEGEDVPKERQSNGVDRDAVATIPNAEMTKKSLAVCHWGLASQYLIYINLDAVHLTCEDRLVNGEENEVRCGLGTKT